MKYLLLLLLSFNIFADHFIVKIKPNNPKHGELSIDAKSQEDAKEKLVKWIERQKVYKGVWSESQDGSIVSKEVEMGWTNESGEAQPILETRYFIPSNFSVKVVDVTAKKQAEIDARLARIQDIKKVKTIDIGKLPINPQLKKILKRLVQEIGE